MTSPGRPTSRSIALPLLRFAVRALRITASTLAVVALLQQNWVAGSTFSGLWLLILAASRWLPLPPEPDAD